MDQQSFFYYCHLSSGKGGGLLGAAALGDKGSGLGSVTGLGLRLELWLGLLIIQGLV